VNRRHVRQFAETAAILMLSTLFFELSSAQEINKNAETVMVTYHAKPGSEAAAQPPVS
jgi:hypothetical protein